MYGGIRLAAVGSHAVWARRYLSALVEFASFGSDPLPRESEPRELIDQKRRARMEAAAGMFVELGVIDSADAAAACERLEGAIASRDQGLPAEGDEDLANRARALLDARLVAVAERPELPRMPVELESPLPADPRHKHAVARFEELVEACTGCGALSAEELSRWRSRLREVDDGRSWHLERERRQQRLTAADLRMVLAGPPTAAGGIRVTSAELYADGVVLRWHETGGSLEAPRTSADLAAHNRPGRRHVALRDDLGTEYLHFNTGEMHTGEAVLWSAQFATAVPDRARELMAEIRDHRFRLPLARAAGGQ